MQQSNAFWLGSGQCTINHQGLFLRGPLGEYQSRDTSITSLVFNRVPICWLFYSLVVIVRCKFPSFYPSRHPRWVTINSRKVIQRYGCDFSIMVLHMCGLGWWHGPPITRCCARCRRILWDLGPFSVISDRARSLPMRENITHVTSSLIGWDLAEPLIENGDHLEWYRLLNKQSIGATESKISVELIWATLVWHINYKSKLSTLFEAYWQHALMNQITNVYWGTTISIHWSAAKWPHFTNDILKCILRENLNFHWNLFLRVKLTISHHWFRWCFGTEKWSFNSCSQKAETRVLTPVINVY